MRLEVVCISYSRKRRRWVAKCISRWQCICRTNSVICVTSVCNSAYKKHTKHKIY